MNLFLKKGKFYHKFLPHGSTEQKISSEIIFYQTMLPIILTSFINTVNSLKAGQCLSKNASLFRLNVLSEDMLQVRDGKNISLTNPFAESPFPKDYLSFRDCRNRFLLHQQKQKSDMMKTFPLNRLAI